MKVLVESPEGVRHTAEDFGRDESGDLIGYPGWTIIAEDVEIAADGSTENVFDEASNSFVLPLPVQKQRKWMEVKELRNVHENGNAVTPIGVVQADDVSKIKISGLVQMAQIALSTNNPFSETFILADNSAVPIDATATIGLGVAVGRHVSACHARARELRQEIFSCTSQEELEAIDITTGWPSVE